MKKLFLILILFLIIGSSGCEKFLYKKDPTATSFDEFYNTEEDLRRVIYSSYLDFFTTVSKRQLIFYMKEGRSDNAYARIAGDYHQIIANGSMNSNSPLTAYYWTHNYQHIGRENEFIANADVPYVEDESVRKKYVNILKGLRIWHYFILTFEYGDIPFVLHQVNLEEAKRPATPREEIVDTLLNLGEKVANNLPPDQYTTDSYMFNKYSFLALVMRYALYFKRYQLAARLAKEIIDSHNYELYPNYGDLFNYNADKTNKEFIIRMDMASHGNSGTNSFRDLGPHFRTGNGQSYCVPTKALVDAYWTLQGRPIDKDPLHSKEEYELNPSLNRDPRYSASIMGQGDLFYGEKIDIYDEASPMYHLAERSSRTGYWFKKFVDPADAFKSSGNMVFPLLRYAEVLLTYAEAKIMLNDMDQLTMDCINQIRERAGLDMSEARVYLSDNRSQDEWIKLIRNERRIELAGEGLRYADIKRWRIAEDVLNQPVLGHTREVNGHLESIKVEDRSFSPNQYLWPINETILKINPNLKQNPGY